MRKPEEEKKKGGSRGIFVVLLVIMFGFFGGILWLQDDVDAAQAVLDQSRAQRGGENDGPEYGQIQWQGKAVAWRESWVASWMA